jgi:hypothetical protein
MEAIPCHVPGTEKRRKWKLFGAGLAVRLIGVLLIWLGDGHDSVFRKGLVVLGLILFDWRYWRFTLSTHFRFSEEKMSGPVNAPPNLAPSQPGHRALVANSRAHGPSR